MSTISIDIVFSAVNKAMPTINALDKGFSAINNNLWKVNQAAEAWNKTSQTINQVSAPFRGYNQGMADLESITGITGKELEGLGKTARKTGKESGLGAEGAIEAYKLLASQIDVSKIGIEGLNDLQKNTITLAQASGMNMASSANALAGTINQFGYGADQAGRVINVLAAGSKYGAAEIYELAASFKVAGAGAAAAGLNVEQTGGAVETLSKMNLKGSEAGTALRNVLLKMQTELGFDFKVTKLSDALATLSGKEGDAAYMAKVFGAENMAAAQFLIKNSAMVEEMTGRMTDTNVATEQANIRNKTFTHWLDVKRAKMNDLSIAFFQHNEGLLKGAMATGQMAAGITTMLPMVGGLGKGLTGAFRGAANTARAMRLMSAAMAAGKLGTYSALIARYGAAGRLAAAGLKVSTIAQGAWNAITKFSTATMGPLIAKTWAWTAALWANPITWIVAGVIALAGVLVLAWKKLDWFRGAIVAAWESAKAFGSILAQAVIGPLKQIIGGIGKVGQAISLLFKGQFSEAAKTAKEGFADIGKGAVKSTAFGVVANVVTRRKEITDAAQSGYAKGKAIDTSNFMNFKGKKKQDAPAADGDLMYDPSFNFSEQQYPDGKMDMPFPDYNMDFEMDEGKRAAKKADLDRKIARTKSIQDAYMGQNALPEVPGANNQQKNMQVVKSPKIADQVSPIQSSPIRMPYMDFDYPSMPGIATPNNADAKQPAMPVMATPSTVNAKQPTMPGMATPSTVNAYQPTMKVVKAPGTIDPMSVPQPAAVNVPANMAMNQPAVPGINIPATIDAQQPTAKPMTIPGIVSITTPKIEALNITGTTPQPPKGGVKELPNWEALTNNITTNISKNEIKNQTANQTNNDSTAKIEVTYSPVINISSAMDQRATDDLMKMLSDNKDELMKLINEEMRRNNRLRYAR